MERKTIASSPSNWLQSGAFTTHKNQIFAGGNHFDIDPNLGRQDALPLTIFEFKGRSIQLKENYNLSTSQEEIRSFVSFGSNLIIGVNDGYILKQNRPHK